MAFNINSFLNEESRKESRADWKPVKISAYKLHPASEKANFYHLDDKEVADTADTIELIGLQQYPVVKPISGTDEYEIVAGHKRHAAIMRLLSEGKTEYEMIPCKIEVSDDVRNELILIFTNSTQRQRTDYEKMQEIKRVKELLTEYQKTHDVTGKKQNIIAGILGTNKTKVGTLENIDKHLIEPFRKEFAEGRINTSTANEIAGLDAEAQQALYETYKETGSLTAKEAKAVKEPQEAAVQPQEPSKEEKTEKTPKAEEKAVNEPQAGFMNEPETKVTFNQPAPDTTDRKSLIINGKINMNKEYNGMKIMYFMEAIIGSTLFDTQFWSGWKENSGAKWEYISDYAGTTATYNFKGAEVEQCEATLTNEGLQITRYAAGQQATIIYDDLAELIDLMIYTKVIEITTIESDLKYWASRTARELVSVSNYLTESEIYILQDLMMKCKERAGI